MIQTSLFRETFKYFAKFPELAGVKKSFNVTTSRYFEEEYNAFRTEIDNLGEHSIVPGIKDYVFGVNEDLVEKRIKGIEGFFLFIDYGNISIEKDEVKTKSETFMIVITVAVPVKPESYDHIESILFAEQALDYLRQIRNRMEEDSRNSPYLQHLTFPNEITPFFARELHNSTGFSMIFSKKGVGLLE